MAYRSLRLESGRVLSSRRDDDRDFNKLDNLLEDIDARHAYARRSRKSDYKARETLDQS